MFCDDVCARHTRIRVARAARSHTAPLIHRAVTAPAARRSTMHMSRGRGVGVPCVPCVATYFAQNTARVKSEIPTRFFFSWIEPCGPHGPHGCPRAPAIRMCETTSPLVRPGCLNFIGHPRDPSRNGERDCPIAQPPVVETARCRYLFAAVPACYCGYGAGGMCVARR